MHRLLFLSLFISLLFPKFGITQQNQADSIFSSNNVETWADSVILNRMNKLHIPGASFALVKGTEIILLKGYGHSNLAQSVPMDPHKSHFDMGSIPKALVATAMLQLVADHDLDLHTGVDKWVPYFDSNSEFGQPITIHHLLTHSAGLDVMSNIGSASRLANEVPELDKFIRQNQPVQVATPGQSISYSNLGYAILGRIMEIVSGMSFPDYMEENVLIPLHMNNSSFHAKLSPEMESNRVIGYEFLQGANHSVPINFQFNSPAAGLRSTAGDMANFMIMQLNHGVFRGTSILDSTMIAKMQSRQFSNHSDIKGIGYSLREEVYNGWKTLAQNGGWQGFNHDFYLFKEHGIGMIVCLNADDNSEIGSALVESFTKHFLPPKGIKKPEPQPLNNIEEYVGVYRTNQYSRTTISKLGLLLGFINELEIRIVNDSLDYYGTKLIYEGNDVFRRSDGGGKIAFKRNRNNEIERMIRDYSHYDANEKIPFYKTSTMNAIYYLVILFIELVVLVLSALHWIRGQRKKSLDPTRKRFLLFQISSSLLPILFIIGLFLEFSAVGPWDFQYGITPMLKGLLFVPFLMIIQLVFMVYILLKSYQSPIKPGQRLWFLLSLVNLGAFLLFLWTWNFIGFNY